VTVDIQTPTAARSVARPIVARSPLDGYAAAFAALDGDVALRALSLVRSYNVRVGPGGGGVPALEEVLGARLPGVSRWNATSTDGTIVWLGPDEWLVTDPTASASLESELRTAVVSHGGAVVDQSGQRMSVLVTGHARGLLAKGAAIDLHPTVFPSGSAVQTFLGQTIVVFLARSRDGSRIELLIRSSFARYAADWLLDAASDPLASPATS
jgi:sarcosine oxidase, subunit gamma